MAVKLRLRRIGKKKKPHYRIVAIDSRASRDGKYIEKLGNYNPLVNPPEIIIDEQKALLWLNRGAIPTSTVRNLFRSVGIMMKWHLEKKGFTPEQIDEEVKKLELVREEKLKKAEALKIQEEREKEAALKKEQQEKEKQEKKAEETAAEAPSENEVSEEDNAEMKETATTEENQDQETKPENSEEKTEE